MSVCAGPVLALLFAWLVLTKLRGVRARAEEMDFVAVPGTKLPCFTIEIEHYVPRLRQLLQELELAFSNLEARETHSLESLVSSLERIVDRMNVATRVISHLEQVRNLKGAQEIHAESTRIQLKIAQSKHVFEIFQSIRDGPTFEEQTEPQKRIVEAQINKAIVNGIALDDEKRALFNEYQQELDQLTRKFSENLLNSTKQFGKLVTNKQELDGLPATCLALAAEAAVSKGHQSATLEHGPWLIMIDKSSYLRVMPHLKNRALREELYWAYRTKASTGDLNNTPLATQIIKLRDSQAKLLGYKNYAELSMLSKMATLETAQELLEHIRSGSWDGALQEFQAMKCLAASNGEENIMPWDLFYWTERLREANLGMNEEELRPFLAFPRVLEGLFRLVKTLFLVEIEAADELAGATIWHKDVRFFQVKDVQSGKTLAYFYLDPYSRPSEKRSGAWVSTFPSQRSKQLAPDGCSVRLPVCIIVCNQTPPLGNEPSLMTFQEMKTLYHEFGHALQHMLTTQEVIFVAGMQNVERDAVELPSQFMENWCYDKKTLLSFAIHYKSGELLPESLLEKLAASRKLRALQMLQQILLATVDLELHSRFQTEDSAETIHDVYERLSQKIQIPPVLSGDRYLCSFLHISTEAYAAGYYGYMWAEVLSADAFSAFEEAGLENEEAVKKVGLRFRDTILALGGGKAALEVFKEFRGRGPSVVHLLRQYGLSCGNFEQF